MVSVIPYIINFPDGTWAYDYNSNTWEEMAPSTHPDVGWEHAMAYDSESDRVIFQGGVNDDFTSEDTWAYDYNSDTWTKMNPSTHPGPRSHSSMDYDVVSDRCILFGGYNIGGYIAAIQCCRPFKDIDAPAVNI